MQVLGSISLLCKPVGCQQQTTKEPLLSEPGDIATNAARACVALTKNCMHGSFVSSRQRARVHRNATQLRCQNRKSHMLCNRILAQLCKEGKLSTQGNLKTIQCVQKKVTHVLQQKQEALRVRAG